MRTPYSTSTLPSLVDFPLPAVHHRQACRGGSQMRTGLRWTAGVVVVLHGLIHSLGAAKGLGWSEVSQLTGPISTTMGVTWLAATALVVAAGAMLAVAAPGWW